MLQTTRDGETRPVMNPHSHIKSGVPLQSERAHKNCCLSIQTK